MKYEYPSVSTPAEAMKILKVSRSTIYKLIANGDLKVIRIGRAIRIPRASLVDFVETMWDNNKAINEIAVREGV